MLDVLCYAPGKNLVRQSSAEPCELSLDGSPFEEDCKYFDSNHDAETTDQRHHGFNTKACIGNGSIAIPQHFARPQIHILQQTRPVFDRVRFFDPIKEPRDQEVKQSSCLRYDIALSVK